MSPYGVRRPPPLLVIQPFGEASFCAPPGWLFVGQLKTGHCGGNTAADPLPTTCLSTNPYVVYPARTHKGERVSNCVSVSCPLSKCSSPNSLCVLHEVPLLISVHIVTVGMLCVSLFCQPRTHSRAPFVPCVKLLSHNHDEQTNPRRILSPSRMRSENFNGCFVETFLSLKQEVLFRYIVDSL